MAQEMTLKHYRNTADCQADFIRRNFLIKILPAVLLCINPCLYSAQVPGQSDPVMLPLAGDLRVHDPAIIRQKDTYYVFGTGGRRFGGIIPIITSKDLITWQRSSYVFQKLPEWVGKEVPQARSAWAPDIAYFEGRYYLYYSVSTFGTNNSAIGLVTNTTLNPDDPEYNWQDQGMVVRSKPGRDSFNAIDANFVLEEPGKAWLSWGSFWEGIKMRRIDIKTGKLSDSDTTVYSLASRPTSSGNLKRLEIDAIEAPFIIKHNDYWYLFVSFDLCCRGRDSTYKIMAGRSKNVTGPYIDENGRLMTKGGGRLILQATTPNWAGPGHCSVLNDQGTDYLVFHAYHGQTGRSELKISTLVWQDGWPGSAPLP